MSLFFGICIHIIFLFSIFDIYFKSPIVKGVPSYYPQHEATADRLVLFIADGLRAESFVNYTTMPYLRSIANEIGRWGVSHTRVPTESRPGHVAVIAGFYEDPSAVAKGWKENPVDFDSVFNQSIYTWCWGTYDIIDIFTKGVTNDHIYTNTFDPYDHSFSTDKNTTLLDSWVFERVVQFFEDAKNNDVLNEKLHQKKIVLFLHLLGTDTAGHTHKPKSLNYLVNLKFVDDGIKRIQKVIEEFYNYDNRTAFIMTSDHGMTDWGSHGAGDNHETETPYVLWGSGFQQITTKYDTTISQDTLSLERRLDIHQADFTPLMSTILSIPVPVNSVGKVPIELLDMSLPNKAKSIYSNSRQLASQYNKKRSDVETNALFFLYQPYEPLNIRKYKELIEHTEVLLSEEQYEKLIALSDEIIHLSLSGLIYYHNYYQGPLQFLITLSFMGWIMYLLSTVLIQKLDTQIDEFSLKKINSESKTRFVTKRTIDFVALLFLLLFSGLIYVQNLPIQYYAYSLLPIYLWWKVLSTLDLWVLVFTQAQRQSQKFIFLIEPIGYILGSVAMGLCFSYRWILSLPLVGLALWPLFMPKRNLSLTMKVIWTSSCILLSMFSFMPVVGKDVHIELVVLAGFIWLCIYILYVWKNTTYLHETGELTRKNIIYNVIQIILLLLTLQNVYLQSKRFENATPVSSTNQIIAWIIAIFSIIIPLGSSQRIICRLMAINTSLLTFYILLSVSHEGLFLTTLMVNILSWIYLEFKLTHSAKVKITNITFCNDNSSEVMKKSNETITLQERSLSRQDFRRAFFFLLYIILSFFGTGNIASLNSFEVRWVTCFITSFQPFVITTLILLKTLTPFICVACCFHAIQIFTRAPTDYLHIIVLIYSNIMGLQLLFYVKNTGSWLEIGTSISQYVIVQLITVFVVLIHHLAKMLTQINIYRFAHIVFKSRKKYV